MPCIESIRAYKTKVFINLDNGQAVYCSPDIVGMLGLKKGLQLDEQTMQSIKNQQSLFDVKKAALTYAEYASRTIYQVRQALEQKGFNQELIDFAISFLTEFGYLDDEVYCKIYIEGQLARKTCGQKLLKAKLLSKGIPQTMAEKAIRQWYPNNEQKELIEKALQKKLRSIQHKDKEKQKKSLIQYLLGKGFVWSEIKEVLCKYSIEF
jgi:regulatory protein